jgi:hypothetical protein
MPNVRRTFAKQATVLAPHKRKVLYVYLLSLILYDRALQFAADVYEFLFRHGAKDVQKR